MDGVNIVIKHLGRRFLFTSWLLGSDISQSVPSSFSNPFPLPRTPSHKHTALSLSLSIYPLFLSLSDQQRRRGQRAGEEEEEQEGRLSDSVVGVCRERRGTAAVSTPPCGDPVTAHLGHQPAPPAAEQVGGELCLLLFHLLFSLVLVLGSRRRVGPRA